MVAGEIDPIEPAIGRPELILAAYAFTDYFLLDAGCLGKCRFGSDAPLKGIKGVQQAYREGRARPESGTIRKVAIVMDLKALGDTHFGKKRRRRLDA